MEFRQTQLDNGLTVAAEVNPAAASAAMGFFVRAGARDEWPAVAGVSHFLEHMMFKGSHKRSAAEVNLGFDEIGASYNAATSEEKTVYFGAVLPEYQDRVLDLLCDLLDAALRQDDFDVEKQVILDEIALYEDRPTFRTYVKLMATFFEGHPLGNDVLGSVQSVTEMARDDMESYFRQRYSPDNIIVVGAGDLDYDAFVRQLEATCSHWRPRAVGRDRPPAPDHRAVRVVTDKKIARQHLGLMAPAPAEQDDARYAAGLASTIIGDVTNSRFFYSLIEPALADDAFMIHEGLDGAGAMYIYVSCDPDRTSQVLQIVRDELARFQEFGPTADELASAKNKFASGMTLASESPMSRLMNIGN
ncbi:MAG: M16 family metallopeptidase, partial [Planctomycetota bacterium]